MNKIGPDKTHYIWVKMKNQAPPPWIPKPEVSVVSVQPQDSSIKDDDDIPYSSSDEEPIPVIISCAFQVR